VFQFLVLWTTKGEHRDRKVMGKMKRGPEWVAREVTWSEVLIQFLQGAAQSLC
jgi:hypothetical protein